ncbi:UDP-N-acetylmuramoyl-L-alanyl-D-glutamate--2,6-diaminopimelate ligase [Lottiidibacillus patelloidae]|uniref:UDP-N-acetylmuramoyl-L-alanyl-D-glutamate--2,6-diaminopimelate ligase n=1 Tax=Lottiidibacillus patelloidae TaxID=2670334 RepID=A0A263BYQ8_9BACI|nr:UDP-N-acetylmuramoyl-L-alanyl-D-glutamate--2,6-diaminopimelate ligase [Lottiidibacillus patelloidae]OZM58758.1 UDP-N-acetylmuramoyl-L-alanyl-D-glutamate--2,6-diaminopimelate ligase [Lottiidibacillus patelloidae]
MKLEALLKHLFSYTYEGDTNINLSSIEIDSRLQQEGSLFVCIRGSNNDGHQFAKQAVDNGAVAVVAEYKLKLDVPVIVVPNTKKALAILADAFYGKPSQKMKLIGITGTNGKTTISYLLEKILQDRQMKTGLIGTINMKINNESYDVKNTTPDALFLQRAFRRMLDNDVEIVIMEVSSHALDYGRVWGCDFNIAVFTNLSQEHLDYHKTMVEYKYAKSLLFSQLGNTYHEENKKIAIINEDDEQAMTMKKVTSAHTLSYSIEKKADFRAKEIDYNGEGTTFTLVTAHEEMKVQLKLLGIFSVYNALAAIATSFAAGVPVKESVRSLEKVTGVPGRFEVVQAGQKFPVIVDYAHTPDSLENALITINEFARGKIFVVVGCGGDRDKIKRPLMASIAEQYSDVTIFTSDNPRTEDPEKIIKDMEEGVKGKEYLVILNREKAIKYAVSQATDNDVILIAGKGHETYQTIGTKNYKFDDREVARNAIKEL